VGSFTFWQWSRDSETFLRELPPRLIRPSDADGAARRLRLEPYEGVRAWRQLVLEGRIVRTNIPIGRSARWCYWQRSNCSIRITDENRALLASGRRYGSAPK